MRAWIYHEKEYGSIGARRWEVEWWVLTPNGQKRHDADPDYEWQDHDIESESLTFKTRDEAMRAARKVVDSDVTFFGCAEVHEQVVDWLCEEDGVAEWQTIDSTVEEVS